MTLAKGLTPVPAATLKSFDNTPFQVRSVGDDNPLLTVTCSGKTEETDDASLAKLQAIAGHITELDLGRSQVTDAACATIAKMPRLTRLDLRQTTVGDGGIKALSACKELRSLNLFGTKVGDYSLLALQALPQLERLYVWQSKVTAKGVVRLREKRPGLRVVFAADLPEPNEDAGNSQPRRRR